jgi:hypothetical protein
MHPILAHVTALSHPPHEIADFLPIIVIVLCSLIAVLLRIRK